MYGYQQRGEESGAVKRVAVGVAAVLALSAIGWFAIRPLLDNDSTRTTPQQGESLGTFLPPLTTAADTTTPTDPDDSDPPGTSTATTATTRLEPTSTVTSTSPPERSTTTTAAPRPRPNPKPAESRPRPVRTTTSTTTTTTTAPRPDPTESRPVPTLPDGTPEPLVVIFDTDRIVINGNVGTKAQKERIGALALANSKFPDVDVDNNLRLNPAVPASIGARVIELTSTRFPESSAEVLPAHARELDRVATVMKALPRVTVLVVGHADQRGDEMTNFALSEQRAQAVVTYLVGKGVDPTRLSSRSVGESDLLSINDDAASLALNRRTEFIFYGLLLE